MAHNSQDQRDVDLTRLEHLARRQRWLVQRLGELALSPGQPDQGRRRAVAELVDEAVQIDEDLIRMARVHGRTPGDPLAPEDNRQH